VNAPGKKVPVTPAPRLADWVRLVRALESRFVLRRCADVGLAPWVEGRVWIHDGGSVYVGDRVRFCAAAAPIELHAFPGAEIHIGNDVRIEGGASIEAHRSVVIGDEVVIGAFCKIIDNHLHRVRGDRHQRPESAPVVIEAKVTLGRRAIVLPGAHLRSGAVVAPGALVRRPALEGPEASPYPSPGA
jgi:acetyltransferase-like isoleucine patch superfamily enzyme